MPLLPAGMPAPPSFRKFNPADQPIMFLGLTSETLPMYVLDDYAETMIAPRISMVNGVSQVQVQGAQKYAVRVQVDPQKLQSETGRPERSEPGAAELERQPADGPAVRPGRDVQHPGGRAADERGRVPPAGGGVPEWGSAAAVAGGQRRQQRRRQQERVVALLGEPVAALDQPVRDAAARQQHHRNHGRDPRAAAEVPRRSAALGPPRGAGRSLAEHPRGVHATSR